MYRCIENSVSQRQREREMDEDRRKIGLSFRKSFVASLRSVRSKVVLPKGFNTEKLKKITDGIRMKEVLKRSGKISMNLLAISEQMRLIKQKTEVFKEIMNVKGFMTPDAKGRIDTEKKTILLPNAAKPVRDLKTQCRAKEIISDLKEENIRSEKFMVRMKRKLHVMRVKACHMLNFVAPSSEKLFTHTKYFNEPKRCETKVFKNRTEIDLPPIKPLENVDDKFYREIREEQLRHETSRDEKEDEDLKEYFCKHKCGFSSGSRDTLLSHEKVCTFSERKRRKKARKIKTKQTDDKRKKRLVLKLKELTNQLKKGEIEKKDFEHAVERVKLLHATPRVTKGYDIFFSSLYISLIRELSYTHKNKHIDTRRMVYIHFDHFGN